MPGFSRVRRGRPANKRPLRARTSCRCLRKRKRKSRSSSRCTRSTATWRTRGHRPVIPLPDGRKVDTLNDLAEWIAAQQKPPVSMRTLYRWLDRFDKGGLAALGEAPRRDKGQSRYFAQHPLAAEFLRHKWLNEGLSAQMCWEALRRDWKNIGEPGY